ncbi:MAG: hypothetical protein J5742_02130 [Alphaproteobacteria bacterium]|nr:hypothetical protein [Alphaproteobacteria bacterium]
MPMKPRHKRRTFWTIIVLFAVIVISVIVLPSFIKLNEMREHLESAIFAQTGVVAHVKGDITFGLLGQTTIIAHDVDLPHGSARSLAFKIPFTGLFNPTEVEIRDAIGAVGADVTLTSLETLNLKYDMAVKDSVVRFMGKDYHIIDGLFHKGTFDGLVRTGQHKYDIRFNEKEFTIKNRNLNLNIQGELFPSGAATGTLEISTDKINSWFQFDEPKFTRRVNVTTDFWWDGGYGFRFYDLVANNVHGNIEIDANGWLTINLTSDNTDFDFSFLSRPGQFLRDSRINVDFYGNLKFNKRNFNHIKLDIVGTEQYVQVNKVIADDNIFTGGTIDKDGAHEIMVQTLMDDVPTKCLFSGTEKEWTCEEFVYGDLHGSLHYTKNYVVADITSNSKISLEELNDYVLRTGARSASVKFKFANMGGRYTMTKKGTKVEYDYVYGKNLRWLNPNIKILPEFMMTEPGNIIWTEDTMSFIPNSGNWSLTLQDNFFYLTNTNMKNRLQYIDLRAINDFPYILSGSYNDRGDISNLTLKIAGHVFTGTANQDGITLHTDKLILDTFLNKEFFDRYEEMEFLSNAPILLPFEFHNNVYLTANALIYGGNTYKNFVYALKAGTQTFSITDNARGNLLATIIKEQSEYDIFLQLNKFVINDKLLAKNFPLNVSNTSITAEMQLHTSGHVAHDIWYNMVGDIDLTFDGGYLYGIGIDDFYANAENINRLNIEDMTITALESGITRIKNMRVIGKYNHGNFETTKPLTISVHHADITGSLAIVDNSMSAKLDLLLRATAPDQITVSVTLLPNGRREYSLSEIMKNFDPAFMRSFIRTHNKF